MYEYVWLPCSTRLGTMRRTATTGIEKPTPELTPVTLAMAELIPTTSPARLSSGPPELPGLMAASVWITPGKE